MKFFKRNKESLNKYLKNLNFSNTIENEFLQQAIIKLEKKQNEEKVLQDLRFNLRQLAVKGNISTEGLELLTNLSKPNFGNDFGRTFFLWFS